MRNSNLWIDCFFVAAPLPLHFKIVPVPLARQQGRTQDFLEEPRGRGKNPPTPKMFFLLGFRPLDFGKRKKIKLNK